LKECLIAIVWLFFIVYGLTSGLYGLVWPEKYLRAWWTPTRGLDRKSAGTPEAQGAARFGAAVAFVTGLLCLVLMIWGFIKYW
jgi:hypothetical protein